MEKVSLILEGGGMRGVYTSGVLDALLESGVYIKNVFAVSAGSLNGIYYISGEIKKSFQINMKYYNDPRYISTKRLIMEGNYINSDFLFDEVFTKLEPFNFDSFKENVGEFFAVATNVESGEAHYAQIKDIKTDFPYIKASIALPFFTKIVHVNDLKLADGGVVDSIPISYAIKKGYNKNIVILTRPKDYVMEKRKRSRLLSFKYKKYPNFIKSINDRYINYNKSLKLIEKLENEGKIIVIRPSNPLNIGRLETNKEKIINTYQEGYQDGLNKAEMIKEFLKENSI